MKNVLIYPFTEQQIHLVRYLSKLNPAYQIGSVCAYPGSGLVGKDVAYVRNGDDIGVTVCGNPMDELDKNDVVVICPEIPENQRHAANELIKVAREKNKEVLCFIESDKRKLFECLDESCEKYELDNKEILRHFQTLFKRICIIDTPVVFIGSLDENLDQIEVLCGLTSQFLEKGYRVSAFGNCDTLELLGMHSYNFLMEEADYDKKILNLNMYVKSIEEIEHPDVIIIQVPGTMLRYNDVLLGDFGVNAYMFSEAFKADYFICCSVYDTFSDQFFKPLSAEFERKFGFGIDAVHLSNKLINIAKSMEQIKTAFYRIKRDTIEKQLADMPVKPTLPVMDLISDADIETVCNAIISKLEGGNEDDA